MTPTFASGIAQHPGHREFPQNFPVLARATGGPTDHVSVYVASAWPLNAGDESAWTLEPKLRPVSLARAESPDIGRGSFRYVHGVTNVDNAGELSAVRVPSFDNQFVRVVHELGTGERFLVWSGFFLAGADALKGPSPDLSGEFANLASGEKLPHGQQLFVAVELSGLLSESLFEASFVDANEAAGITGSGDTPFRIDRVFDFNGTGPDAELLGNMGSREIIKVHGVNEYRFLPFARESDDPDAWNAYEVARHVLGVHNDTLGNQRGPSFQLGGAAVIPAVEDSIRDAERIVDVWRLEKLSVWNALNAVFDFRRMFSFSTRLTDGGVVTLDVHTNLPANLPYNGGILHPNVSKTNIDLNDDTRVTEIVVKRNDAHAFDEIHAESKPIVVCGTFLFDWWILADQANSLPSLVLSWDATLEQEYNDADAERRQHDRFGRVWQRYRLNPAFKFMYVPFFQPGTAVGGSEFHAAPASDHLKPMLPATNDDGQFVSDPVTGYVPDGTNVNIWPASVRFLPWIPLAEQVNYSTPTLPQDRPLPPGAKRKLLRPFILAPLNKSLSGPHNAWVDITRAVATGLHPTQANQITGSRSEPGINVRSSVAHLLGVNHYANNSLANQPPAAWNWERLSMTAAFELNTRARVVRTLATGNTGKPKRILRVQTRAEYWFCAKGTIIGTEDSDGTGPGLQYYQATAPRGYDVEVDGPPTPTIEGIVRQDRELLEATASMLTAWYGSVRDTASFVYQELQGAPDLGFLMVMITKAVPSGVIIAPLTETVIEYRGEQPRVRVSTGWQNLDPRKLANFGPAFQLGSASVGGAVSRHELQIREMSEKGQDPILREEAPATGTITVSGATELFEVVSGFENPFQVQRTVITGHDSGTKRPTTTPDASVTFNGYHRLGLPLALNQVIEGILRLPLTNETLAGSVGAGGKVAELIGSPQFAVADLPDEVLG